MYLSLPPSFTDHQRAPFLQQQLPPVFPKRKSNEWELVKTNPADADYLHRTTKRQRVEYASEHSFSHELSFTDDLLSNSFLFANTDDRPGGCYSGIFHQKPQQQEEEEELAKGATSYMQPPTTTGYPGWSFSTQHHYYPNQHSYLPYASVPEECAPQQQPPQPSRLHGTPSTQDDTETWYGVDQKDISDHHAFEEDFLADRKISKDVKKVTTMLNQLPGLEKIRWQSILQGTRSPDVGEREIQRRVKEAETIGARLFGGDIEKLLGSILNQHLDFLVTYVKNLQKGKKKHNKIRNQLSEILLNANNS